MDHQDVKNPLDIPEVLHTVLKLLNFEDLKKCRQVNKLWQQNSLSLVRKLSNEATFANSSKHQYFGLEDMRQITNLINNSDGTFPVTKFEVFTSIAANPATDDLVVGSFISSVSQTVTELTINYGSEDWVFHDSDNFLAKGTEFFSLTVLQLEVTAITSSKICAHGIEQFVTKVIEASPKLSTIFFPLRDEFYTCWIEALSKAASLRNLIMRLPSTCESMEILSSMAELKLQRLNVFITEGSGKLTQMAALFKMFLQSQSATLKSLRITDFSANSGLSVEFPVMEKLTELEIMELDNSNGSNRTKFTNISYNEQFPVLKRLDFTRSSESWRDFFPADSGSRQGLETIEEINFPAFFTEQDIWAVAIKYNLAKWMPDKNLSIQEQQRLPNVEKIGSVEYFMEKMDAILNNFNGGN